MRQRFRASNVAWIGQIPEEWDVVKSKVLFSSRKEIVGGKDEEYERLALTLNGVVKRSKKADQGLQPTDFKSYQILREDELVFKLIDLQNTATSRVGISPYEGIVSPAYIILRRKEKALPRFYYYFFHSLWQRRIFNQLGDAGVRSSLGVNDLLELKIPFPPLAEQERIAKFLDRKCGKIDEMMEKVKAQIEKLEAYKKSLITEAVTKGITKAKLKPTGNLLLPEVPDGWSVVRLKHIVDTPITDGPHETPEFVDEGIPFVSAEASHDGRIFLEECRGFISRELHEQFCKKVRPQRNDIFIVKSGSTTGKTVMVDIDDEFSVWSPLALVRVGKKANCKYVFYFLSSPLFQREVQDNWSFGTQPNIAMGALAQLILPCPPLAEQKKIADWLDEKCGKVDEIIKQRKAQLEKLAEYKKSLIYEYVTGKKEVSA